MRRRHAVHEEFASALTAAGSGVAVLLSDTLADAMRVWSAREQSGSPAVRFETSGTTTNRYFELMKRILEQSGERLVLLMVGDQLSVSGALCATEVACQVARAMLSNTRPVSALCLSTVGGVTFDVDDESGRSREFYVSVWGSMTTLLDGVIKAEMADWASF